MYKYHPQFLKIKELILNTHNQNKKEIIFAENVIKHCDEKPIYARVDIIYDDDNKPSLSELELNI